MRLAELQTRMRQTLLTGGSSDPELLALLADPPPQRERRLAVYRNNVRHALLSVLDAAFPVVRELLGADCFSATTLAIGPMAFGSAWRMTTRPSDSPFSRAIST